MNTFVLSIVLILPLFVYSLITVASPDILKQILSKSIEAKFSLFGSFKYGFTTNGKLYYDASNIEEDYACSELKEMKFDEVNVDTIPIILIDRGNCSFVTKVRNVQNIGGQVAPIVNNKEDDNKIFGLNDDGTGSDIRIPGILISKKDGNILKEFISQHLNNTQQSPNILLRIDNEVKNTSQSVDLRINYLANDIKVYQIIDSLEKHQDLIQNNLINLIPIVTTTSNIGSKYDCLCHGRYCVKGRNGLYSKNELLSSKLNDKDILNESIRQKCLFNLVDNKVLFWNYLKNFYQDCLNMNQPDFSSKCSFKVMDNIDSSLEAKVRKCFDNSFVYSPSTNKECEINTILEDDYSRIDEKLKAILPVIYINENPLYGAWNYENVMENICADLVLKPDICFSNFPQIFHNQKYIYFPILFCIIFFIMLIIVLIYVCKFYSKKRIEERISSDDLNSKISEIVMKYIALRESN